MNPDALPEGTLIADGLDDALLGWGQRVGQPPVAVYDRAAVCALHVAWGMSEEEAEEFVAFNVEGAWVGEGTPIFLVRPEDDEAPAEGAGAGGEE